MRLKVSLLSVFLFVLLQLSCFATEEFKPVLIYQGNIENNSFNTSIADGVRAFEQATGIDCEEVIVKNDVGAFLNKLDEVASDGYSPVFILYGNQVPDILDLARRYPATRFFVHGLIADGPNMYTISYAEHEGSFLAGALAAMKSQTNIIGFISVEDMPIMRRFWCGYVQGAKYVNPDIKVLEAFVGSYEGAWVDTEAAANITYTLIDAGADVVYQAAGGAGIGVLKVAAERGVFSIGVDINQNGLYPGSVLTSMLKKTGQGVYAALKLAQMNIWRDNYKHMGLAQDAVGLAFDEYNKALVSNTMRAEIDQIRSDIILGKIKVHDYVEEQICY